MRAQIAQIVCVRIVLHGNISVAAPVICAAAALWCPLQHVPLHPGLLPPALHHPHHQWHRVQASFLQYVEVLWHSIFGASSTCWLHLWAFSLPVIVKPLLRQVRRGVATIRCREIKAAAMDRQRRVIKMVSSKHWLACEGRAWLLIWMTFLGSSIISEWNFTLWYWLNTLEVTKSRPVLRRKM